MMIVRIDFLMLFNLIQLIYKAIILFTISVFIALFYCLCFLKNTVQICRGINFLEEIGAVVIEICLCTSST